MRRITYSFMGPLECAMAIRVVCTISMVATVEDLLQVQSMDGVAGQRIKLIVEDVCFEPLAKLDGIEVMEEELSLDFTSPS